MGVRGNTSGSTLALLSPRATSLALSNSRLPQLICLHLLYVVADKMKIQSGTCYVYDATILGGTK